jgi:hypothetical protein
MKRKLNEFTWAKKHTKVVKSNYKTRHKCDNIENKIWDKSKKLEETNRIIDKKKKKHNFRTPKLEISKNKIL